MLAQKPNVKMLMDKGLWRAKAQTAGNGAMQWLFGVTPGWHKKRDIVRNNAELGIAQFKRGQIKDAVFRLKLATWLDPKQAEAWFYLGRGLLILGKRRQATAALKRALAFKEKHEETLYLLIVATGRAPKESPPMRIPPALALEQFDALAKNFSRNQLEVYRYRGHELLAAAIRGAAAKGRLDHAVLDMGCGSGLCGGPLRDIAGRITGVDLSPAMLEEAKKAEMDGKRVYDELVQGDLLEYLRGAAAGSFDVAVAGSTLSYVGDPSPVTEQAARVLKPGGLLAFTVDKMDGQGWRFDAEAGRFRFSKSALEALARQHGLSTLTLEEAEAYPEYFMWLVLLRK